MAKAGLSEWKDAEQLREDLSNHHLDLTVDDHGYNGPFLTSYPLGYSKSKAQEEAKKRGVDRIKDDEQMVKELKKWHRGTPDGVSAALERGEDNEKKTSRLARELNSVGIEDTVDRHLEGAPVVNVAPLPHISMPDTALHNSRAV